ncbi:MAG: Ni/Fe-hydrogenase cytochrome b subunit [Candidatus Eisenbacteria sp.]|nr:Ni/Fe-hydrogenase cytochrome b subunit [Candidatus Eisenbacteria bacterium]
MNGVDFKFGKGSAILLGLALIAGVLVVWRFAGGLGTITNLNDGYAWGFWIGFDILAGIALAAGGFVMAAVVYLFGNEKYHPLIRPAILTAFLGYLLFIVGLIIDLGRPWNIYHVIFHWQHHSAMFEVSWCVMCYTLVLALEFVPNVFERFNWTTLTSLWRNLTPLLIIVLLTVFTAAMTHSVIWTVAAFLVLALFEIMVRTGAIRRDPQVPTLLIMAGVVLSTLHQSSLGTLFLVATAERLHPLYYSPLLPLMFLVSAVMVGPAMVMFESLAGARVFHRKPEMGLLSGLAKVMPWLLGIYILIKLIELGVANEFGLLFGSGSISAMFIIEMLLFLIPFFMFLSPGVRNSSSGLLWGSLFVAAGVVVNRLAVTYLAHTTAGHTYTPDPREILVTIGLFSAGILVFAFCAKYLPIFEEEAA